MIPSISIIIPSYNNCKYLHKLLEIIQQQTYKEWVAIIVDDGSTDNSIQMIQKFAKEDSRIFFYQRPANLAKGAQACRNYGYEKSKTKYVCFFDSDDLITTTCIEKRVHFMESNPEIDFGIFKAQALIENDSKYYVYKNWTFGDYEMNSGSAMRNFIRNFYPYTVWTNIYRRSSIRNISWDEKIYLFQDFDFNIQCLLANLKFKFANNTQADYYYRVDSSPNSIAASYNSDKKFNSTIYLFSKILNRINSKLAKDFKVYIFFYYTKLINTNDLNKIIILENFIEKKFGKPVVLRFKIVKNVSRYVKMSFKKRKFLQDVLMSIISLSPSFLIGYKNSLQKIIKRQRGLIEIDKL